MFKDLPLVTFDPTPSGWRSMYMGLVSPFSNRYKSKLNEALMLSSVFINNIVQTSKQEAELVKMQAEAEEKVKQRKSTLKRSLNRRISIKQGSKLNLANDNELISLKDEVEVFKYLNSLSEKKQVALLHSILSGRVNAEAERFLSAVHHLKQNNIGHNKFKTLVKQAYPDVFLFDLKSDMDHYKLALNDFSCLNHNEPILKTLPKRVLKRSASDPMSLRTPFQSIPSSYPVPTLGHLRRKSCICSS